MGPKIEVDKNTTLGKIDIPLKAEEGKTYKVAGVYSRTSRWSVLLRRYIYEYSLLGDATKISTDTALYVVYKEVKDPVFTIKTQPVNYEFYNSNGSEAGFKPELSLTANLADVDYEDGMYFVFNWQELRKGAEEYIDCPLTHNTTSLDRTRDASECLNNDGSWADITDTLEIKTDGTDESGRVVAREGAKFKCNVILKDKSGNTICTVTTNEVEVIYKVRVTLHDGDASEDLKIRYGTLVKDAIPASYEKEGVITTWQTRARDWNWNQGYYYVYTDYDTNQAVKTTPLDLYVKREAVKFNVTFEMNDHGKQVPAQTVEHGKYATEPTPAPTDDSYTFGHCSLCKLGEEQGYRNIPRS